MKNNSNNTAPVCKSTPLELIKGCDPGKIASCKLLPEDSIEESVEAFKAAPQFAGIDPQKLILRGQRYFRLVLVGKDSYYLRQAAVFLTSFINKGLRIFDPDPYCGEFGVDYPGETDLDFDFAFEDDDEDECCGIGAPDSIAVVEASLIDRDVNGKTEKENPMEPAPEIALANIKAKGIFIHSKSGTVLSDKVVRMAGEAASEFNDHRKSIFIALRPEQINNDLIDELEFLHGFTVLKIGSADNAYLERFMKDAAAKMGADLASDVDCEKVINNLKKYRGRRFEEVDIERLLSSVHKKNGGETKQADLMVCRSNFAGTNGYEALQSMVGLAPVKDSLEKIVASIVYDSRRASMGIECQQLPRHLAFAGNPGTGKSVSARIFASILREEGIGSGVLVEAGREQLIGSYLGQTSPKIASLFEKAKGGILFIDEAGALVNHGHEDIYATEAINALVRHMELNTDTTVIFATYPDEMKQLLDSNPGLSSRISHVVEFADYSSEELWKIFCSMAEKDHFKVEKACKKQVCMYLEDLKNSKGKNFGNGRDVRKLYQAACEELKLRNKTFEVLTEEITSCDVSAAMSVKPESRNCIGFRVQ